MALNFFQDFKVMLTWLPGDGGDGQILVRYEPEKGEPITGGPTSISLGGFGTLTALGAVMSANVEVTETISHIIEAGRDLADLLLPEPIRTEFRKIWQNGPVRLRLIYPNPEITDPNGRFVQITKLLEIPWEQVYLSQFPEHDSKDNPEYLLGLRNDISIVHTLKQPIDPTASVQVDRLRVTMQYLSRLDTEANAVEDERLFKDFVEELARLNTVMECVNIEDERPFHINLNQEKDIPALPLEVQAEREDVLIALQHDNLVHVVSHGDPAAIYLDEKVLQSQELALKLKLRLFGEIQQQLLAKVALILSCGSGDGDGSVVAALHRNAGVPMVVGTSNNIPVEAARRFTIGFYRTMAVRPSDPLEKAVSAGRQSTFILAGDQWYTNFGRFRLFMNSPDSILIPEKQLFGSDEMVESFDPYIRDTLAKAEKNKNITLSNTEDYQKKLNEWVQKGMTRWFFVSGGSGSGKTAQIARFVNDYMEGLPVVRANLKDSQNGEINHHIHIRKLGRTQIPKLIYHFCRNDQPETGDPLTFVRSSLVPQLIHHFGEQYFDWCPRHKFPLLIGNARDILIDFVCIPLAEAKQASKEPPLIVIDNVHFFRLGHGFENSILKLLFDHWGDLVNVARFVIAADETNPIAQQKLEALLGQPDLRLLPEPAQIEDIKNNLKLEAIGNVISLPKKKAGPLRVLPLFYEIANRFGDSIKFSRQIPLEVAASPEGVNILYQTAITSVTQTDGDSSGPKAQLVLDLIAAAYEPLFPCDLAALIGADDQEMADLLHKLAPFLAETASDEPLGLFHDSLQTYLQGDVVGRDRLAITHDQFVAAARPRDGWAAMSSWVNLTGTAWGKSCGLDDRKLADKGNRRKSRPATALPRYVRRYLALHAYEAYRTSDLADPERPRRADEFIELVCDPGFRTVRLGEVGREAALQDIRNALRLVYSQQALLRGVDHKQAVTGLDHLLGAHDPVAPARLLELEKQLRLGKKGQAALAEFLGLA